VRSEKIPRGVKRKKQNCTHEGRGELVSSKKTSKRKRATISTDHLGKKRDCKKVVFSEVKKNLPAKREKACPRRRREGTGKDREDGKDQKLCVRGKGRRKGEANPNFTREKELYNRAHQLK